MLWITHPKEALKDVFLFLGGNANAEILDARRWQHLRHAATRHQNSIGLGRIFHAHS